MSLASANHAHPSTDHSGSPCVVAFHDLSFGYGDRRIIDRVSFEIRRGEVVSLMGGSGVGKTTLLRLMSGLVGPQQGRVDVFGKTLDRHHQQDLFDARRRIDRKSVV